MLRAILDDRNGCVVFPAEGIVSRAALQSFFRVGNATLQSWHKMGLKPVGPGLRSYFYFARDVVELFERSASAPPIRRPVKKTRIR